MHLAAPSRRALGLAAVTAIATSTTVFALGGVAQAADPWTFDTDTLTYVAPGEYEVTVPDGICGIEWTLIGGEGGPDQDGTAGALGGEYQVTTVAEAGETITLYPGGPGQDWDSGADGGFSAYDLSTSGGPGTGAGGGGGAATIVYGPTYALVAYGGDGAGGPDGGAGGGDEVNGEDSLAGAVLDEGYDGPAQTRTGAGVVSGVGVPCASPPPVAPATPAAPWLNNAEGGDGSLTLDFTDTSEPGDVAITGYQYTKDAGTTWTALTTTPAEGRLKATVTGLTNGTTYTVQVRAVGANGTFSEPSQSVEGAPIRRIGAPTGVVVTASPSALKVTWNPPAGDEVVTGYDVGYSTGESGSRACSVAATVRSCVIPAQPGIDYSVTVYALDGNGDFGQAALVHVGFLPAASSASSFPASVPAKNGDLVRPAGQSGSVAPNSTVRITGGGYLPNSTVTLLAYSTPQVLTTTVADGAGNIDVTVTIPAGLAAGSHTLVAAGVDAQGNPRYLTLPITVAGGTTGSGGLAYTGASVAVPAIGGLAALVVGGGLVVAGRRRRTAE